MTMTEDIVNEICEAGTELFPNENNFFIIHDCISKVTDEEGGFYPSGEKIKLIDTELSIETQAFICDVDWLNKNMGLLFLVNSKTIGDRTTYQEALLVRGVSDRNTFLKGLLEEI